MLRSSRSALLLALLLGSLAACGDDTTGANDNTDAAVSPDASGMPDAGVPPDAAPADAEADAGSPPWTGVPMDRPLRLLFIGNSFTQGGPVPTLVSQLATSAGWPTPEVDYNAPGGETLGGHTQLTETLELVDAGDWDFVVLQEYSVGATDNAGDPAAFKSNATWFYDRIKASSPAAQVVLYETWARHPDHGIYPGTFTDPAEMQAQIRLHYNDAADSYIPANATATPSTDVQVAPVGDAWEHHLVQPDALRLHATDDYHAGANGQYLNAAVLYSTIYGVVADGVSELSLATADAERLQAASDATTGITRLPPAFPRPPFALGQSVQIDFGTLETTLTGWSNVVDCVAGQVNDLVDHTGATTGVDVQITDAFSGANESGVTANTLGYPDTVSQDVCWTGSFNGHTEALLARSAVTLSDLAPGHYELRIFASRTGDDGGLGRLTRYEVHGQTADLEISDNTGDEAVFLDVSPDAAGHLLLEVSVSPAGSGRFAYLGSIRLTKTAE